MDDQEKIKLEFHCLECDPCLEMMAKSMQIHEQTMEIGQQINNEDLIARGKDYHNAIIEERTLLTMRWAASKFNSGNVGESFGVAVTGDLSTGTLIECNAWVGNDNQEVGKLELWGIQVEGDIEHRITLPLDYLEHKLEGIFRTCSVLRIFNLDHRIINVDLKERVLMEANSLSLSIIMAIINAIYEKSEDTPYVYSSDIRQDGKLERVGGIDRKIEIAQRRGIKNIILSNENKSDCPKKYLDDPNLNIVFFDTLEEVFNHFDLLSNKYDKFCNTDETLQEGHVFDFETAHDEKQYFSKSANEWDIILNGLDINEETNKFLNDIFPRFEDLCISRNTTGLFCTVILIGNPERIKTYLPDSEIGLISKYSILEIFSEIKDLTSIVNGREMGFVLNESGIIDSIRKVNVEIAGRQDLSPLLMEENHKYACLSLFTDALVVYFPPTGRHLHIFQKGKLIGKYLNGKWRKTDYDKLEQFLFQVSQEYEVIKKDNIDKVARSAIAMTELGLGGIFTFLPNAQTYTNLYESRLEPSLGLKLANPLLDNLDEKTLINLAKDEGAVIIDTQGRILACHAYFNTRIQWKPGMTTRHQHACQFSKMANSLVIVASRYGTVTIYYKGNELICI